MSVIFHTDNIFDYEPPEFDCLVTSPPYYLKRRYDVPDVRINEDKECDHDWQANEGHRLAGHSCRKCGAYEGQHGLEPNVHDYVRNLGELIIRLSKKMKPHGCIFINIGDTYSKGKATGAPEKGLYGVPHRLGLYIQSQPESRLIWRNDIVWLKKVSLPEGISDRLPMKHEYIMYFSFGDSQFDRQAITKPHEESSLKRYKYGIGKNNKYGDDMGFGVQGLGAEQGDLGSRVRDRVSLRDTIKEESLHQYDLSFWEMGSANHSSKVGKHYAPMPLLLAEICIKLGSRKGQVIFDPFGGTGTTAAMATKLGRNAVSVDLDGRQEAFYNEHLGKLGVLSNDLF